MRRSKGLLQRRELFGGWVVLDRAEIKIHEMLRPLARLPRLNAPLPASLPEPLPQVGRTDVRVVLELLPHPLSHFSYTSSHVRIRSDASGIIRAP